MTHKSQAFLLKAAQHSKEKELYFATVGGFRSSDITAPAEDKPDDDITVKAHGVFVGSGLEAAFRQHASEGSLQEYELSWEGGKRQRGKFIAAVEYAGDFNGERSYNITLSGVGRCYTVEAT